MGDIGSDWIPTNAELNTIANRTLATFGKTYLDPTLTESGKAQIFKEMILWQ